VNAIRYDVSRSVRLDPAVLARNRCVAFAPHAPELDFYRVLRTRVMQGTGGEGGCTIMVTSALPEEGKTLTAINLALTFAMTYQQTAMLVDADLRRQNVHEVLGYQSDRGLAECLLDGVPFSELIVWPGVEKLTLVSGGRAVPESSELLGSPAMKALVGELKSRYSDRYVLFDVPPVLSGADALTFAPLVDYILFVVRGGQTPVEAVKKAFGMLPQEKVLGLVMNR